jgi:hypothetical protein
MTRCEDQSDPTVIARAPIRKRKASRLSSILRTRKGSASSRMRTRISTIIVVSIRLRPSGDENPPALIGWTHDGK